jgi:putative acetyltransferase
MVTVEQEDPRQDAVVTLLKQSEALAALLYPNEWRRPLTPDTLAVPGIVLFIARDDDHVAAGCCALIEMGSGEAELKRMIVDGQFRRRGVGMALLRALEVAAIAMGIHRILMEVGVRNTDGQALYRRAGYTERGPFGSHRPSPVSLFFEKSLDGVSDNQVAPVRE